MYGPSEKEAGLRGYITGKRWEHPRTVSPHGYPLQWISVDFVILLSIFQSRGWLQCSSTRISGRRLDEASNRRGYHVLAYAMTKRNTNISDSDPATVRGDRTFLHGVERVYVAHIKRIRNLEEWGRSCYLGIEQKYGEFGRPWGVEPTRQPNPTQSIRYEKAVRIFSQGHNDTPVQQSSPRMQIPRSACGT
jgi:hypothetical protein